MAVRAGKAAHRGEAGMLTIGLTPAVPPAHLAALLRRFATDRPRVRLQVRETGLEDALASGCRSGRPGSQTPSRSYCRGRSNSR
ncbi:LysR substrate-binding domain-containing protein [Streptomyces sp. NPDC102365]|uniref:LysR substrate-binding domain-containing protein n=1 Tax=Streptomyces sp. NPDC102365 TaxID=3366162 RepID=UPI003806CD4A